MIAWLDPGRLFWPVPAHSVSVFYGIGRRKASARRRDVRINSAEVLRNRSLIILVGHTKRASEPQLPIDHIRPNDRGWSVLERIAEAPGVLADVCTEGILAILRSRTQECFCGERVTSARSQARCASGAN